MTQQISAANAGSRVLRLGQLDGDDIGHEIVPAAVRIANAAAARAGLTLEWKHLPIGQRAFDELGHTLPPGTLDLLEELDGWVLGPIGHSAYPAHPDAINPHPILRKHFDLFANVRPTRSFPDIGCLFDDVDLVMVRENNEGFQPDRNMVAGSGEFCPTADVAMSVRVITREGSAKVARAALDIARTRSKRLTLVHKRSVFKLTCGLFVDTARAVAAQDYPDVTVDDCAVDTFAMRLLRDHRSFDTVVTTNMFGDILTDQAAGMVGGLGMAPGLCIGRGAKAMAQATHGSAPDIAGRGIANPYAMVASTGMLLAHLGRAHDLPQAVAAGRLIDRAMADALADPATRTGDILGTGDLSSMTDAILSNIERGDPDHEEL